MTVSGPIKWLALAASLALTGVGLGLYARKPVPEAQPVAESPGCSSCDARHARLRDLSAIAAEGSE